MPAILSALEDKIRIPARPCNILYIYHMPSKQNHAITLIFFARTFGELTDSAAPLLNLLELLIVNSVHRLHALRSTICGINTFSETFFTTSSSTLRTCILHYRYAANQNLYKPRVRTNAGKQTICYVTEKNSVLVWAHFHL